MSSIIMLLFDDKDRNDLCYRKMWRKRSEVLTMFSKMVDESCSSRFFLYLSARKIIRGHFKSETSDEDH